MKTIRVTIAGNIEADPEQFPFIVHIVDNNADSVEKFNYARDFKEANAIALARLLKYKKKPCFARIITNDSKQVTKRFYVLYTGKLRDVTI